MKKIKLTKAERIALEKSINHWKEDIQRPLKQGDRIDANGFFGEPGWKRAKRAVKCYGHYCALCTLADKKCLRCVYTRAYGFSCDSHCRENSLLY